MTNKEICGECGVEMGTEKNGVTVSERDGNGDPYKLWHADLKKCHECGKHVVCNFADVPYLQHPDAQLSKESAMADFRF
ncbi:MAG: hypothetical protein ACTSSE_16115 [Candidatus Thorarchaeota archaeon]